jgi:hypothetical protein
MPKMLALTTTTISMTFNRCTTIGSLRMVLIRQSILRDRHSHCAQDTNYQDHHQQMIEHGEGSEEFDFNLLGPKSNLVKTKKFLYDQKKLAFLKVPLQQNTKLFAFLAVFARWRWLLACVRKPEKGSDQSDPSTSAHAYLPR